MTKLVQVKKLCKAYPTFSLTDITFDMYAGRIVGFVGRNGAGKSTTVKAMLNLVHTDSGEIFYFGLPFSENEEKIKQRIGYSTGAVNYYPKKKIKDIVAVTKTFYSDWDDEAYEEYRSMFEIDENKTPCELSEGMKVKLNLLLALSHRAEVLILDEPTSGLDPFSRDELSEIFLKLKEKGIAILFSTHIISDIEKCADDIVYIQNGRLTASCSKDEFIERYGKESETLEEIILRMEREAKYD